MTSTLGWFLHEAGPELGRYSDREDGVYNISKF